MAICNCCRKELEPSEVRYSKWTGRLLRPQCKKCRKLSPRKRDLLRHRVRYQVTRKRPPAPKNITRRSINLPMSAVADLKKIGNGIMVYGIRIVANAEPEPIRLADRVMKWTTAFIDPITEKKLRRHNSDLQKSIISALKAYKNNSQGK